MTQNILTAQLDECEAEIQEIKQKKASISRIGEKATQALDSLQEVLVEASEFHVPSFITIRDFILALYHSFSSPTDPNPEPQPNNDGGLGLIVQYKEIFNDDNSVADTHPEVQPETKGEGEEEDDDEGNIPLNPNPDPQPNNDGGGLIEAFKEISSEESSENQSHPDSQPNNGSGNGGALIPLELTEYYPEDLSILNDVTNSLINSQSWQPHEKEFYINERVIPIFKEKREKENGVAEAVAGSELQPNDGGEVALIEEAKEIPIYENSEAEPNPETQGNAVGEEGGNDQLDPNPDPLPNNDGVNPITETNTEVKEIEKQISVTREMLDLLLKRQEVGGWHSSTPLDLIRDLKVILRDILGKDYSKFAQENRIAKLNVYYDKIIPVVEQKLRDLECRKAEIKGTEDKDENQGGNVPLNPDPKPADGGNGDPTPEVSEAYTQAYTPPEDKDDPQGGGHVPADPETQPNNDGGDGGTESEENEGADKEQENLINPYEKIVPQFEEKLRELEVREEKPRVIIIPPSSNVGIISKFGQDIEARSTTEISSVSAVDFTDIVPYIPIPVFPAPSIPIEPIEDREINPELIRESLAHKDWIYIQEAYESLVRKEEIFPLPFRSDSESDLDIALEELEWWLDELDKKIEIEEKDIRSAIASQDNDFIQKAYRILVVKEEIFPLPFRSNDESDLDIAYEEVGLWLSEKDKEKDQKDREELDRKVADYKFHQAIVAFSEYVNESREQEFEGKDEHFRRYRISYLENPYKQKYWEVFPIIPSEILTRERIQELLDEHGNDFTENLSRKKEETEIQRVLDYIPIAKEEIEQLKREIPDIDFLAKPKVESPEPTLESTLGTTPKQTPIIEKEIEPELVRIAIEDRKRAIEGKKWEIENYYTAFLLDAYEMLKAKGELKAYPEGYYYQSEPYDQLRFWLRLLEGNTKQLLAEFELNYAILRTNWTVQKQYKIKEEVVYKLAEGMFDKFLNENKEDKYLCELIEELRLSLNGSYHLSDSLSAKSFFKGYFWLAKQRCLSLRDKVGKLQYCTQKQWDNLQKLIRGGNDWTMEKIEKSYNRLVERGFSYPSGFPKTKAGLPDLYNQLRLWLDICMVVDDEKAPKD